MDHDFEAWDYPDLRPIAIEAVETPPARIEPQPDDLMVQLALKQAALDEQINYLQRMGLLLEKKTNELEGLVLKNVVALIKKAVKKIIFKEIEVDETLLETMIQAQLETLPDKVSPCTVFISRDDKGLTTNNVFLTSLAFKVDDALKKGDFIIQTDVSSIEALLADRINRLFEWVPTV